MRQMTDAAIAYVAAMIDAEGVVTISRQKGNKKHQAKGGELKYTPLILVTNSHAGLIGFLAHVTGEGITYHNKKPPRPNWSPMHRWQCSAACALRVLNIVLPYLVIKREIGELVAQFKAMPKKTPFSARPAMRSAQADLYERVKVLNTRGAGSHRSTMHLNDYPHTHPLLV